MGVRSQNYLRWALEMRRNQLFQPGERVGVAVSGGPDSVLLLDFMSQFAHETGLILAIVHFNHHLRGAESDEDERFVRRVARGRGLPLFHSGARVAEIACQRRRNLEATGRELRYRFFYALIGQHKVDKIATAHTANDQAETVLLRLLRGTGMRGLGGIYPSLDGKIVRPFLNVTRSMIEQELDARELESRVDSTNLDVSLKRNKIRRKLLPLIEGEYCPEIIRLLGELSSRARDDEAFLEEQARERAQAWRVREGDSEKIPARALAEFHPAIARRALRQVIQGVQGTLRNVTFGHIEEVRRLAAEAQSGRKILLPSGMEVRKEFGWLIFSPVSVELPYRVFSYAVEFPGTVDVPELGAVFEFKIVQPPPHERGYNKRGEWALDARKVASGAVLRSWRAGDQYQPAGSHRPEKLKELFRRAGIPSTQRALWPVLEGPKGILWVRGFPPSQEVAIRPHEGERLEIAERVFPAVAHD